MYWNDFQPVDELPETGGERVCYVMPDSSWWEYGFLKTDKFEENGNPVYKKGWRKVSGNHPDHEFRDFLLGIRDTPT